MGAYANAVAWWQSHQLRRAGDLDKLLLEFNPLFFYHSNLLEGWEIPFATVQEYIQTGAVSQFSGNPKVLLLLYNQKQCYEYLRERVLARDELDTTLVLESHRILSSGVYNEAFYLANGERAGEFKKKDYVTAVNAVGAPARDVSRELDQLMEEVNGYCGSQLLRAAAYFHGQFEHIHPFAAGNGTVGRVLLNFFLLTRDHPPVILFSQDEERYFQCLTSFDRNKDATPLAEFLEDELVKSWGA